MNWKIIHFLFAVFIFLFSPNIYGQTETIHWCNSNDDEVLLNYRHFTKMDKDGYTRLEYIQRKTDKEPILFFKHERVISFALGRKNKTILINNSFASKANEIDVCDLGTLKSHQIDSFVLEHYKKYGSPKKVHYVPDATDFSPDEHEVLISFSVVWVEGSPLVSSKKFKDWSYVVSAIDGKILKIYKKKNVPVKWWVSGN